MLLHLLLARMFEQLRRRASRMELIRSVNSPVNRAGPWASLVLFIALLRGSSAEFVSLQFFLPRNPAF